MMVSEGNLLFAMFRGIILNFERAPSYTKILISTNLEKLLDKTHVQLDMLDGCRAGKQLTQQSVPIRIYMATLDDGENLRLRLETPCDHDTSRKVNESTTCVIDPPTIR